MDDESKMPNKDDSLPNWVIDKFREFGKKGGRPRTIVHTNQKGCECVECRRAAKGKPAFGRKPKED